THLMHYNALKLHVMRHVNMGQVTNLHSLYCKAEKAEQTSNALHKTHTGKREQPKVSHKAGRSNCPVVLKGWRDGLGVAEQLKTQQDYYLLTQQNLYFWAPQVV
ncbi:hypothetical protein DSO57_1002090, partial [Entomophthora muscae]